jgi:DNA-binding MarR family transcriptional regulator
MVKDEIVAGLIKDLGSRLSAMSEEFNATAERLLDASAEDDDGVISTPMLLARAREILAHRKLRRQFLPAELFHEPAWDMLIALFVAHDDPRPTNVKTLVGMADAPVTTSQRWIEHLHKLKLIDRVSDPADRRRIEISLSSTGYDAVTGFLTAIIRR